MTDSTSQTTMSNVSLTSTEANEQAKDCFVHSVRKYDLKNQVYPLMGHTHYVHEFAASTTVLQHVISTNAFDFKKYVPYRLEKGKMSLFPEFMRYFMKAFMVKSDENMAYCIYDEGTFQTLFSGTKKEIVSAVKTVERDFSATLLKCFSPALQEIYSGWTLTRSVVETRFQAEIMEESDELSVAIRKEELRSLAKKGNLIPYVEFLMAFEHGEQFIWSEVAAIVSDFTRSDKQIKFTSKKLAHWKKVTKGLLKTRIEDFLSDLKDEGIVAEVSAPSDKKRKADSETLEHSEPEKGKISHFEYGKSRSDGYMDSDDELAKTLQEKIQAKQATREAPTA